MGPYSYSVWKILVNKTVFSADNKVNIHIVYRFMLFSAGYSYLEAMLGTDDIFTTNMMNGCISMLISIECGYNMLTLINKCNKEYIIIEYNIL
jgi:hypothetical protein